MTDSINPTPPQKSEIEPLEKHSPWVMFITVLLLIGGLLLTSAMLGYYGLQYREGAGNVHLQFTRWLGKGKALVAKPPTQKTDEAQLEAPVEAHDGTNTVAMAPAPVERLGIKKFFTASSNTVKWPKLKLSGFGNGVNTEDDFAIINEKKIMVGSEISNVKLLEVRTHGILVEFEGEQKVLTEEMPR